MDYVQFLRLLQRQVDTGRKEIDETVQNRDIFDQKVLEKWRNEPDFIERIILTHIVESFELEIYFEYISGVSAESSAFAYKAKDGDPSAFFLDAVFDKSMMYLFLTVLAVCYHPESIEKCRSMFRFLVRDVLVGREKTDGEWENIIEELHMDDRAVTQAFDLYWAVWTFMAGYEIYHIMNRISFPTREEEFRADRFGFQVLIRLIQEQKAGKLPEELDCFYEEYYLAPCMLMEIFRNMDLYREKMPAYGTDDCHPSPEERMQALIDLFDTDVPDDMDTENGNAFLSAFLDAVELINGET